MSHPDTDHRSRNFGRVAHELPRVPGERALGRREFLLGTAAAAAVGALKSSGQVPTPTGRLAGGGPVVISSANGLRATERAAALLNDGADTLDAVVSGVNIIEEDPADQSVGYGGLPNEEGIVELDASVMHGPTRGAGAVAALRNIKTPSRVAQLVMSRTDHVLLVGEGALRFARAHGFKESELLTEDSRRAWIEWKERLSDEDDWLAPPDDATIPGQSRRSVTTSRHYGTITCCAWDGRGSLSGVTTTSGLSFKLPGRVGDSPLIGAGLFVDNDVGAAGSTGRGEAVIKVCGAHSVIEAMRNGVDPVDACLDTLRRIVQGTISKRLVDHEGRPKFDVKLYALAKGGRHGAASIWSGARYAVYSEGRNRLEDCAYLYARPS